MATPTLEQLPEEAGLLRTGSPGQADAPRHQPQPEEAAGSRTSSFIRVSRSCVAALRMESVFLLVTDSSKLPSELGRTADGVSGTTTLFLGWRRTQAA